MRNAPAGTLGVAKPRRVAQPRPPLLPTRRSDAVRTRSAAPQEPVPAEGPSWDGAKLQPAAIAIGAGLIVRFLVPVPDGLTVQSWQTLAIFVSTVFGLVLEPLPVGAWAFCGLTAAVITNSLTFQAAFAAFTNEVIWLIVCSFFFAKGFEKTGLGERVANLFVKIAGKSTLGLAYGLAIADAIISPAMPSTSARAGGIFMPIVKSLSNTANSLPNDPSRNKVGAFLTQSLLQASNHSSALFLTAAAQNLLCLNLAASFGAVIPGPWLAWLIASCVPAITGILITPWLVYKLQPPEIKDTPEAPVEAGERLKALGPMSGQEKIMLGVMGLAVVLWVAGEGLGVAPVVAAMLGLCLLLFTGVLKWKECLEYTPAWDTLVWFAVLIGMSAQLNSMGVIKHFADAMGASLSSLGLSWQALTVLLNAAYFFLHYLFASQTAHVGALYAAFLAMMIAAGCPPVLGGLLLAFTTNLFGSITHFASGQAAVYFGAGYLKLDEVFKVGGILGVVSLVVWTVLGGLWWKVIGLY
ncbi:unnamed protein product [Pedinophyceae sp. YPF-701]|nr:unnamed protein product [Pedinophyceae sp. YPF-701]